MSISQISIFAILFATVGLFLWGRFRHDVVALLALMACVIAGLVPSADAFAGFGHPAVITVACVLVLSQGLQNTGAVDWLARAVLPREASRVTSIAALMGLGALLSGFMNNVGAMALLMPVAVQVSGRLGLTAGQVLMPLAFGTILGGMTTLIGTPPNLIVSGFRDEAGLGHFSMFDFAPVGVTVAVAGVLFVAGIGWRRIFVGEFCNLSQAFPFHGMFVLHHIYRIFYCSERRLRNSTAINLGFHHIFDEWEKHQFLFFQMCTQILCRSIKQFFNFE